MRALLSVYDKTGIVELARGLADLGYEIVSTGGTLAALAASRWIEPLLFRQPARDPWVFGGVGAVMIMVALVASALPAFRAAAADPNTALRAE